MQDHPPQITGIQGVIGPDNRSNGLLPPTDTAGFTMAHIRIVSLRSIVRIVQASNRQSNRHGQSDAAVGNGFLQYDESAFVDFFIRHDAAKRDFATECIEIVVGQEDRGVESQHIELPQIGTTGITNADQRG